MNVTEVLHEWSFWVSLCDPPQPPYDVDFPDFDDASAVLFPGVLEAWSRRGRIFSAFTRSSVRHHVCGRDGPLGPGWTFYRVDEIAVVERVHALFAGLGENRRGVVSYAEPVDFLERLPLSADDFRLLDEILLTRGDLGRSFFVNLSFDTDFVVTLTKGEFSP